MMAQVGLLLQWERNYDFGVATRLRYNSGREKKYSTEVKNEWSYTSASPVCLHPVTMDKFTFFYIVYRSQCFFFFCDSVRVAAVSPLSSPRISRIPSVNTILPLTHVYQHHFFHWSVWTETEYEFLTSPGTLNGQFVP